LIDLALPGNINSALSALDTIKFYDLDAISAELEDTRDKRISSIGQVNDIIKEELKAYLAWYREAPLRVFLAEYKIELNRKVVKFYQARSGDYTEETISTVTDRVMRKLMKQTRKNIPSEALETIIREHAVL
jgi:glutamyl-tRNA reductase